VEQSSFSEANNHLASQEIPCLFHKTLPLVPVLSQMHIVHTLPPCFPKIHSNINLPPKFCTHFSSFLCVLHALPTSSFLA